ncbi:uncharacterized protein DS421_14g470390 [Arachis hypogaea]|nr:uncharacterized protein DS421_14g470390 [Arachis hypogaea]
MQPSPPRRVAAPPPFTLPSLSEPGKTREEGEAFAVAPCASSFRRHRAEPPPSSLSRAAAAAARVIIAASGSVTVEAGRGQKMEKRPPSPPSQTQEREGARGRVACYRRFCRRRTPLLPLRSVAVAVVGVLVAAAVRGGCRSCRQPVQRLPLFHFLSSGRVLSVARRF